MQSNPGAPRPAFLNAETLLLAHFFLCSIGLLKLLHVAAFAVSAGFPVDAVAARLFDFFSEYSFFREKSVELVQYALSVVALFVYYGLARYLIRRARDREPAPALRWALSGGWQFVAFLIAVLQINLFVFALTGRTLSFALPFSLRSISPGTAALAVIWLIALGLPFGGRLLRAGAKAARRSASVLPGTARMKALAWGLVAVVAIHAAALFSEFIAGPMRVSNEFMDIPEYTLLNGRYVDNTAYINAHTIGGLEKYDPAVDKGNSPPPRASASVELRSDVLRKFVEGGSRAGEKRSGPGPAKEQPRETRFRYDEARGLFVARGRISLEERTELLDLLQDDRRAARIDELYFAAAERAASSASRRYSADELAFWRANKLELVTQVRAGWFFHHHNAMLAPIGEFAAGRPASGIQAQYGWLNTLALAKIVEWRGGLSLERYFSTLYAFYPLYLIALVLVAWLLLRDARYVFLVGASSCAATWMIGHELIRIAPGFNPLRHFLDLFVILALYLHDRRGGTAYLLAAIAVSWVAVLASREFGLFIAIALAASLVIKQVLDREHRSRTQLLLALVTVAGALACAAVPMSPKPSLLLYSLIGVSAPALGFAPLYIFLGAVSVLYVVLIGNLRRAPSSPGPTLFLFLYAQGITIYYVWNGGLHHLLAIAPVWVLLLVLMLRDFLDTRAPQAGAAACNLLVPAVFLAYAAVAVHYHAGRTAYREIFESHRVFRWDFDRASVETTMDPAYFANGIDLIRKYSRQPGIHIISKYDNLLPFLAGRYSDMPFADVSTSLVTPREVELAVDAIRLAKPEYIFVDTDIGRNLNGDIWLASDPLPGSRGLHGESFARVSVLNLLKKVYYGVKSEYEPVEKGILITVYKRVSPAGSPSLSGSR